MWALCVSGDKLFSASSDNTIKVPKANLYILLFSQCESFSSLAYVVAKV